MHRNDFYLNNLKGQGLALQFRTKVLLSVIDTLAMQIVVVIARIMRLWIVSLAGKMPAPTVTTQNLHPVSSGSFISENFGRSSSISAPINRKSVQCSPKTFVTAITAYQLNYVVNQQGSNFTSKYIGANNTSLPSCTTVIWDLIGFMAHVGISTYPTKLYMAWRWDVPQ